MSTTYSTTGLGRTSGSTRYASGLIWKCWDAYQARRIVTVYELRVVST